MLAVSDTVLQSAIQMLQVVLLALITALSAFITVYGSIRLKQISISSEKGHELANSFLLEQKRKFAITTKELAEAKPSEANIAIAKEAEDAYQAHKKTDEEMKARE